MRSAERLGRDVADVPIAVIAHALGVSRSTLLRRLGGSRGPLDDAVRGLQQTMIDQLADDIHMVVSPARAGHLYVLGSRSIPSVLLETGFISNKQEEAQLNQPAHRRRLVAAIRDAIDDYFRGVKAAPQT